MITFTILVITLLTLVAVALLAIGAGGLAVILAFGDIIVCVAIVALLIKLIFGNRK